MRISLILYVYFIGRFSSNVIFENVLYKPEYSDMSIQDEIFVKFEQDYCSKVT